MYIAHKHTGDFRIAKRKQHVIRLLEAGEVPLSPVGQPNTDKSHTQATG